MKFWQYLVGGMFAILVFAAALIVDNRQFLEYDAFSRNPFSLLGTTEVPFGGTLEFLSSGEFVWQDEGAKLVLENGERRLLQGTVAIGGTFFPTSEDTEVTNKLWVGNTTLSAESSSVLVNLDSKTDIATVVTGGGAIEILFKGTEESFVMPAHSQMVFNALQMTQLDPYLDYFVFKKLFSLKPVFQGSFVDQLTQFNKTITELKLQFKYFAWNLPVLWSSQNGSFIQFLEKISPYVPPRKLAGKKFQLLTATLRTARDNIEETSGTKALQEFKSSVLSSPEWEKALAKNEKLQREWRWFEFSQKFWLSVLTSDNGEQNFSILWKDDVDSLTEKMSAITRSAYNEPGVSIEKQLDSFLTQFLQTEFTAEDVLLVSRLRREMESLIDTYSIHKTLSNFNIWITLVHEEQRLLSITQKKNISLEIGHTVLNFVSQFIYKENGSAVSKVLNGLWLELDINETDKSFTEEEQTIIEQINLVGESGMTPEQMHAFLAQKAEQELIEDQLLALEKPEEDGASEMEISNAKELWEFLADKNITLDIAEFRTSRPETGVITRFANTKTDKRKIEGVFDYSTQSFSTLTLGEEVRADLPAYHLAYWIKLIGGKFEPEKPLVPSVSDENEIIQNASQAILGKKVVKGLLDSIGITVGQDQLKIKDKEYQRCAIKDVKHEGIILNAEYNLVTQEFTDIVIEKSGLIYSDIPECSIEELAEQIEGITNPAPIED